MDENALKPAPGVLLVAPPQLIDPNFRRTVVLLCEHDENGSFGLILNRPLTLHLKEVMEGFDAFEDALSLGGPVQPNTLHYIHTLPDVPGAIEVQDGLQWGGEFDEIKGRLNDGLSGFDIRFFLGYAGWTADQLNGEIEQGGWIVAPAATGNVFNEPPERLWRSVLRSLGGAYVVLANYPDDPRMN